MRVTRAALVTVAVLCSAGCYHAVVDTGLEPNGVVIQRDWAHSFIDGLVPPAVQQTMRQCPNGVAKVETQHSFLNMLAAGITWGLYTPMTITVSCATGPKTGTTDGDATVVHLQGTSAEAASQVKWALDHVAATGNPVYLAY